MQHRSELQRWRLHLYCGLSDAHSLSQDAESALSCLEEAAKHTAPTAEAADALVSLSGSATNFPCLSALWLPVSILVANKVKIRLTNSHITERGRPLVRCSVLVREVWQRCEISSGWILQFQAFP